MLYYENQARRKGFRFIVGVDEAGCGPLAGPVVASAVFLKERKFQNRIADSKKITARQRERAFHEIFQKAYVGTSIVNEAVIDSQNILKARFLAMNWAVERLVAQLSKIHTQENLSQQVCLLIDGNSFTTDLPYSYRAIIKGDDRSLSIACASIVAKVIRDRVLYIYDKVFPQYGFGQHKGYPTRAHREAILKNGLSPIHRKTFRLNLSA